MRLRTALAAICWWPVPVLAQVVVVSEAPSATSVTVYRDSGRDEGAFNLRWLRGYALISEKRRVTLPQGESTVRFEGVADGMIAVSAVVSGLPGGVEEKNRDAHLLSPGALLDGSLGNQVRIRRTNPATGKVTEFNAVVRSGANQAVVLETPQGVEALRCSGLPETLLYDSVPDGLSARPTFSVQTESPHAAEVEVTLTYLSTGFDWGASYIATLAPDGRSLDLFSWLTVANSNGASFDKAQLLAVAGKPNQTSDFNALDGDDGEGPRLNLSCWPMDGTSTYPAWGAPVTPSAVEHYEVASVMAPAPMMRMVKSGAADIQVTAMARQEDLGDLKLYRVPMAVDVLPNGQKQVALLRRESVPFTRFYAATVDLLSESVGSQPMAMMVRMRNRDKEGLGVPLPSGSIALLQRREGQDDLLLADSTIADRAIGEKVEVAAGRSDQVRIEQITTNVGEHVRRIRITATNAQPQDVSTEITLLMPESYAWKGSKGLKSVDGGRLWSVKIPAHGRVTLDVEGRKP